MMSSNTSASVEIYYESQEHGSALCGQHAINNLLQGAYFTAIDLGVIGAKLDEEESNLLHSIDEEEKLSEEDDQKASSIDNHNNNMRSRKYSNVSLSGLFSVDVLITALKQIQVDALPLSHPLCVEANTNPDKEQGFIFYQLSHWIAYRKICGQWYDLNSQSNFRCIDPQPIRISDFFLSSKISTMQDDGFQVYVIRGNMPSLGRYAPKANDLKGQYVWYQSADIDSWQILDKESRRKQNEEQMIKSEQLRIHDPQQYNALMGMQQGMPTDVNNLSFYEQQQQIIAMQQYEMQKNNLKSEENNNGMMAKFFNKDAFNKLKNAFNKAKPNSNKDTKVKNRRTVNNDHRQKYLSDLEKAKIASLETAENDKKRSNHVEKVELEMEIKPKPVMPVNDEYIIPKETDMLDLMSMTLPVDDDTKQDDVNYEEKDMELDVSDPFSSLIIEYKSNKMPKNENKEVKKDVPLEFDHSQVPLKDTTQSYESLLENAAVVNDNIMNGIESQNDFNPLLSPEPDMNDVNSGKQMAQNMEDDLWRVLENSLMET